MSQYWIFIVKDHQHLGRIIPAREVLINRVKNKFWSLNSRARYVRKLRQGDHVVFYVASKIERGFMGRGILAGEPHLITDEQRFHIIGMPSEAFDYTVEFSEAEIWGKPISIEEVKDKMPYLKGRVKIIFRGSIIRISEEDYNTLIEARKLKELEKT
ncbi:MAG: EVE domain-containing protein [Nitrososphaerota archaeon]